MFGTDTFCNPAKGNQDGKPRLLAMGLTNCAVDRFDIISGFFGWKKEDNGEALPAGVDGISTDVHANEFACEQSG